MHEKHGHKKHPHHHGGGMGEFHKDHWQRNVPENALADTKYSGEMNQAEDLHKSVDGLSHYVKSHRAKH